MVVSGCDVGRERSERIERRFFANLELPVHVLFDEVHRYVARTLDHRLHVVLPRDLRELAERIEFAELRFVVSVCETTRTQTIAERKRDVVRLHNFADLFEMGVEKILLMVREAPLREYRSASRNDARNALRGKRHVAQQHARVNRKVVDALLGLFDQRVAVEFPREVFRFAVDFLQRLIDRHRADGHGSIAQNPLARLVNVLPVERSMTVSAPHLVAHVIFSTSSSIVDATAELPMLALIFTKEITADDLRLEFGMIDVRGEHGAAARDFVAHEFGLHALTDRDEFHLGRDLAAAVRNASA